MERTLEDKIMRIEELETELAIAKAQAARSKEETKSTRKRLVGCHFQYKKLEQENYDALKKIESLEKDVGEAKFDNLKMQQQEAIWKERVSKLTQAKDQSDTEVKRLLGENKEVKSICEEMLVLVESDPHPQ